MNQNIKNTIQKILTDMLNIEVIQYKEYYISNILNEYILINRQDDEPFKDEEIEYFDNKMKTKYENKIDTYQVKDNGKLLLFNILKNKEFGDI